MPKSDFPNIYLGKNFWQVKIARKGDDGQTIKINKSFAFDATQPKTKKASLDRACEYRDEQMLSIFSEGERSNVDITLRILLNEFLLSTRLKEMKSEESVRQRIKFILKMPEWKVINDRPLRDLTTADFAKIFEEYIKLGKTPSTVNKFVAICSSLMKWAGHKTDKPEWSWIKERHGLFEYLYFKVDDARDRIPNDAEIQAILNATESDNLRHALKFLHTLALRRSEICALKWCDVYADDEVPYIHIVESKNNEERFLPLNDELIGELKIIKAAQTQKEAHLFVGKNGKALAPHALTRAFVRAIKRHNIAAEKKGVDKIDNLRLHDYRRRGISDILKNNKTISLIHLQKISGHKNLGVLSKRYVKMDIGQLSDAMYFKEEPVFKDRENVWSGKGRKPAWVQKLSEEELEKFRVVPAKAKDTVEIGGAEYAQFMAWRAVYESLNKSK